MERSKGVDEPLIHTLRKNITDLRPWIEDELSRFRSLKIQFQERAARKEVILKAMGNEPIALGGAWRESLESIKPEGQIATLTKHNVPDEWRDWYMAIGAGEQN